MFATTGALAPQRSAERKVRLRTGEGVRTNTASKDFKLLRLQQAESTSSYPRGGVYVTNRTTADWYVPANSGQG